MAQFKMKVVHGAPAHREFDVTWADDTVRDCSGLTPTFTAYAASSDAAAAVFTRTGTVATPDGSSVASRLVFDFTATDTAQTANRYATIDLKDGSGNIVADGRWVGELVPEGR